MVTGDVNAVGQGVADYIEGGVNFIQKGQITAFGQKQVAVGVDSAIDGQWRAWIEFKVIVEKHEVIRKPSDPLFKDAPHLRRHGSRGRLERDVCRSQVILTRIGVHIIREFERMGRGFLRRGYGAERRIGGRQCKVWTDRLHHEVADSFIC